MLRFGAGLDVHHSGGNGGGGGGDFKIEFLFRVDSYFDGILTSMATIGFLFRLESYFDWIPTSTGFP